MVDFGLPRKGVLIMMSLECFIKFRFGSFKVCETFESHLARTCQSHYLSAYDINTMQ